MANARSAIERKIASGDYYDAQQMVKTVHRRLCAKGDIAGASELCAAAARRLSREAGQHDLAADLGKELVSALEASRSPPCETSLAQIESVLADIPPFQAPAQKYALLHQALKWSTVSLPSGHPRLHRLAANQYRAEREFGKCQGHYVFCGDGPGLAGMVREWRQMGYPNEVDLFGLRTLLILLSLNDVATARSFWDALVGAAALGGSAAAADSPRPCAAAAAETAAQSSSTPPTLSTQAPDLPEPPVQCGTFLLAAAEARSLEFLRMVRAKYTLVFRRDPTFEKYLDEIEVRVFGAQPQRGGIGAILDMFVSGCLGGEPTRPA